MRKLVTVTLAVLLVGLFAAVVYAAVEAGDDSSSTVGTTETSPHHRHDRDNDHRRPTADGSDASATEHDSATATDRRTCRRTAPAGGVDISGPCDEAEHAGDPRCNGTVAEDPLRPAGGDDQTIHDRGEDNSGPGSSGSGHDGGDDNSGPGSSSSGRDGGDDVQDNGQIRLRVKTAAAAARLSFGHTEVTTTEA